MVGADGHRRAGEWLEQRGSTHTGAAWTNWLDLDRIGVSTGAPAGQSVSAPQAQRLPTNNPPALTTENGGYTSSAYIGYWGTTGQSVRFTVNAAVAGTQSVTLRYRQAGSDTASTRQLIVNGATVGMVSFPRTSAAWADPNGWRDVAATVTLNAGTNTIELRHTGPNGGNYLDLDGLTLGSGRPLYTGTVSIPAGDDQTAYQCVSVGAMNDNPLHNSASLSNSPTSCLTG